MSLHGHTDRRMQVVHFNGFHKKRINQFHSGSLQDIVSPASADHNGRNGVMTADFTNRIEPVQFRKVNFGDQQIGPVKNALVNKLPSVFRNGDNSMAFMNQ